MAQMRGLVSFIAVIVLITAVRRCAKDEEPPEPKGVTIAHEYDDYVGVGLVRYVHRRGVAAMLPRGEAKELEAMGWRLAPQKPVEAIPEPVESERERELLYL